MLDVSRLKQRTPGSLQILGRRHRHTRIFVLEPHDIVFAEVTTALDFDEMQRLGARICESMARAGGNIDRFVLRQSALSIAYRHFCDARNHNPMFGTMVVKLQ